MNVTLTRAQISHRKTARKAVRTCATPNDKPVSGYLIALVVCAVLALGFLADVHYILAGLVR